ncbi:MAG: protein phosphatase 2C domain-containing protein [Clostridiales bacterium]|jgi:hypothetical protein|nr:protein phosphatase 2C domain-containing protein [Clostridiales bacterium]
MTIEKWKQCDAYVQGVSHVATGDPCQDRTATLTENGVMAIALADGAGSKKYSQFGAETACKTVCKLLCDRFDELILLCEESGDAGVDKRRKKKFVKTVLDEVRKALGAALRTDERIDKSATAADLSSTLLFFAMKGDLFIQGHIGDGVIGIWEGADPCVAEEASEPENGAQPNITFFVPDSDAAEHLRVSGSRISKGRWRNIYGVLLMSDGAADLLYEKSTKLFNANTRLLFENFRATSRDVYKTALEAFLNNTVKKFSDDDLSINLLFRESFSDEDMPRAPAYVDELLSGVYSKEQIVDLSADGKLIKHFAQYKKRDFANAAEVRKYLGW